MNHYNHHHLHYRQSVKNTQFNPNPTQYQSMQQNNIQYIFDQNFHIDPRHKIAVRQSSLRNNINTKQNVQPEFFHDQNKIIGKHIRCNSLQQQPSVQQIEEKKQPVNISVSLKQAENLLIRENEQLRNLVVQLRQQVKSIQTKDTAPTNFTEKKITEVDEEKENSTRSFVQEVERLRKQIANEREKYHSIIMNLEKRLSDNDSTSPKKKEFHNVEEIIKENTKLAEVVDMQIKYQEMMQVMIDEAKNELIQEKSVFQQEKDEYEKQILSQQLVIKDQDDQLHELKQKLISQSFISESQGRLSSSKIQQQQKYISELEKKSKDLIEQNLEITKLCQDLESEIKNVKSQDDKNYLNQKIKEQDDLIKQLRVQLPLTKRSSMPLCAHQSNVSNVQLLEKQIFIMGETIRGLQENIQSQVTIKVQKSNPQGDSSDPRKIENESQMKKRQEVDGISKDLYALQQIKTLNWIINQKGKKTANPDNEKKKKNKYNF